MISDKLKLSGGLIGLLSSNSIFSWYWYYKGWDWYSTGDISYDAAELYGTYYMWFVVLFNPVGMIIGIVISKLTSNFLSDESNRYINIIVFMITYLLISIFVIITLVLFYSQDMFIDIFPRLAIMILYMYYYFSPLFFDLVV